jgi:hypothetical protein
MLEPKSEQFMPAYIPRSLMLWPWLVRRPVAEPAVTDRSPVARWAFQITDEFGRSK